MRWVQCLRRYDEEDDAEAGVHWTPRVTEVLRLIATGLSGRQSQRLDGGSDASASIRAFTSPETMPPWKQITDSMS
jgi:hypothetical protein